MLAKTKFLKKAIFYPAVALSALMTSLLFWQFGASLVTKIIFVIAGLCVQGYQVFSLVEYKNSVVRRKRNFNPLMRYMVITLSSCIATVAFGIKEIEKQTAIEGTDTVKIENINSRISEFENKIKTNSRDAIQKQIKIIQAQIPNVTYRVSERVAELNRDIERLRRRAERVDNSENLSVIADLKIQRQELKKQLNNTKGAFGILANIFHVSTEIVMVIFLIFVTVSIESMIYSTSTATFIAQPKPKKTKGKVKNSPQLSLYDSRKVG